jgi:hypothetical protein
MHPVTGQKTESAGFMSGNLIGSYSQWAYIAQFTFNHQGAVIRRTITAVPVSAIELEGIGRGSGCGDLSEIYRATPRTTGGGTR